MFATVNIVFCAFKIAKALCVHHHHNQSLFTVKKPSSSQIGNLQVEKSLSTWFGNYMLDSLENA